MTYKSSGVYVGHALPGPYAGGGGGGGGIRGVDQWVKVTKIEDEN